jgi:UDP-perosamine 4-acetyltransferase
MTGRPIAIVGAGGHAAVIIEAIRSGGAFDPVAVVDPSPEAGEVLGVPVVGGDSELPALLARGVDQAVVAIGLNRLRQKLGDDLLAQGFALPPIVHPSALVSPSARIGEGAVIMARASIGARAVVSRLAVVNTGAIVEHDDEIGVSAHVAPGVALGGCVRIGDRTLVGIGSAARPGVKVGSDVVIGAGSAVVSDLPDGAVVGGAPARPLQTKGS